MSQKLTLLSDIRETFLAHFEAAGHRRLASSALVPQDDPTLLFTNAGMVQFKNAFTGKEKPPAARVATSQKCVRAGGKHNDLDNVGYTARHHTFFEMLGNFSFGDYFKETAIDLAWSLVRDRFDLPASRLLVTVYADDEEAAQLWKKIAGFSDDKIIRIATSDNFWSMGETGPCGPCSEIFFDHGADVAGGPPCSADADGDRFVEIWNLVFMQYEQMAGGARVALPTPSIDTGMGLERIGAVLQGVHSNYETDLFVALIGAIADAVKAEPTEDSRASYRVIADHLRASAFLIADGVTPDNEGRGYVLRRIMRRGMRHAHILGARTPIMHRVAPTLIAQMGAAFPELGRAEATILAVLEQEEERFRRTLGKGLQILDAACAELAAGAALPGETAFKLYDTFGFPLDLTQDILRGRNLAVDVAGFDAAMAVQKATGRANWQGSGAEAQGDFWLKQRELHGPTRFLGYETLEAQTQVLALRRDGVGVDQLLPGEEGEVLLAATPFYAESGGQAGDRGEIVTTDGARIAVRDVVKAAGDLHVHQVEIGADALRIGADVRAAVNPAWRARTRLNHSAAHLVHAALRRHLGPHVAQKGQMVDAERMRFDFAHGQAVSQDELAAIEAEVNAVIRQNGPAEIRVMAPQEAIAAGAIALFGEKYGEEVRVLRLGSDPEDCARPYSVELCGGTHVSRTGDLALFKIVSESAVGAGVRRVEAVTGEAARLYLQGQADLARHSAELLKAPLADLPQRIEALLTERKKLERDLTEAKKALALAGGGGASTGPQVELIGARRAVLREVADIPAKDLRALADTARREAGAVIAAFIAVNDGKAAIAISVDPAEKSLDAVALVRAAAGEMGGQGGGGRQDFAQGGAPDGARARDGLAAIRAALQAGVSV